MGEMREVLESIQDHTSVEIKERYRNPSIGMGEVLIGHSKSKIWIVWKTRARVTPRADKALTPDIFYD